MKEDLYSKIKKLLENTNTKELSEKLNLSQGTLSRWLELEKIPKEYEFDILGLLNENIDYSKYNTKIKNQFFTPKKTAENCFKTFLNIISNYEKDISKFIFIEPSAGNGVFLDILPKNSIAMDIEPRYNRVIKKNYLSWTPDDKNKKYIVFGNPPFGLRGHLALKFINHSHNFADYVCFILPQLFESSGKGVPRKRIKGYNLLYSEKIDNEFYEPDNKIVKINTIFQIWSKNYKNEKYFISNNCHKNIKIYSLSDGGTPSSTRNKDKINKCDIYIPSTCFGKDKMKIYYHYNDLPNKKGYGVIFESNKKYYLNFAKNKNIIDFSFLSTNSAYNINSERINKFFEECNF